MTAQSALLMPLLYADFTAHADCTDQGVVHNCPYFRKRTKSTVFLDASERVH